MAGEDPDKEQPSLELPSLGLFRRRKKASDVAAADEAADDAWFEREEATGPLAEPKTARGDSAVVDRDRFAPVGAGVTEPEHEVTTVSEVERPGDEGGNFEREAVTGPVTDPRVLRDAEPQGPTAAGPGTTPVVEPDVEPAAPDAAPRKRRFALPAIGALPAAVLTGIVVGLATVGLTWLALKGCSGIRGTSTCGNPGFFLLLVVLIAMVYLGAGLLRAWRVADAGSTSFLGVALVAVVAVLFRLGDLSGWVSLVVVPLVGAVAYALAQWVTSSNTSPGERPR